jgi:hypothetical protein
MELAMIAINVIPIIPGTDVFMIKQSSTMDSYMWLALLWWNFFRGEYALWQQLQNPPGDLQPSFPSRHGDIRSATS